MKEQIIETLGWRHIIWCAQDQGRVKQMMSKAREQGDLNLYRAYFGLSKMIERPAEIPQTFYWNQ